MHRVVVALVSLLGLTGAGFLLAYFLFLSASSDRAAALAPADSTMYVNLYLQPSTGQQMNLGALIGRLPGFADDASLDDKIDQVVQNLLGATGVDYREQVKPWLGSQVAVAAWPSEGDPLDAEGVVIVDVKDRAAAEAALADIAAEGDAAFETQTYEGVDLQVAEGGAYAFVGEMLVVGEGATGIESVVDVERGGPSLADRTEFRTTMAGLPADHLGSVFVDLAALAAATETSEQLSGLSTAGAALVAERDGLRLSGSAPFDRERAAASSQAGFALGSEPSSLVDWMPGDALAEIVVFGLRQTLEDAEAAAGATPEGEELTGALDTLRAIAAFGLGIDIDADILPLLDREVAITLTEIGDAPSGQVLLRPEDADAAAAALERVVSGLGNAGVQPSVETIGGVEITTLSLPDVGEIAYAVTDGIVIIGLGSDAVTAAIDAHAEGSTLGSSERYRATFDLAGVRAGNEAYVDIGAIMDQLGGAVDLPDDARDILSQLGTFGFTAPSREDRIEFHVVLTVDEADGD